MSGAVPVTLLSGFLGSGKTTLLEHILRNKEGLRCAVVVNDMAEINIDAALVKGTKLLKTQEKMVELHNGCICCTLREDLLIHLRKLAKSKKYDVIVIESTGISEPMQVAETFFMEYGKNNSVLNDIARLDNCITVVDATTFFPELSSVLNVAQKYQSDEPTEEDDRNVAHLLVDQLEFANLVLLNKSDLATERQMRETEHLIKQLNPQAEIIRTTRSNAPIRQLLLTNHFKREFAEKARGWMDDIATGVAHIPETEEYGIASFVYRTTKPFHPARLHQLVLKYWMLEELSNETVAEGLDAESTSSEDEVEPEAAAAAAEAEKEHAMKESQVRQKRRQEDFGNVFRSKGFVWLGNPTRLGSFGEWNHAGNVVSFQAGGGWNALASVPGNETRYPSQEIVFIGQNLNREVIHAAFDACTLTEEEQAMLTAAANAMRGPEDAAAVFEDPFEAWPDDVEEDEPEEGPARIEVDFEEDEEAEEVDEEL